jgi:hypothetical protein
VFDRVIIVDWSAADGPGPARPTKDRCWLAWGDRTKDARPAAEYFRTREATMNRVSTLLTQVPGARAMVGLDFALGYPADAGLPAGRALAAWLAERVHEGANHQTNRFEAAGRINAELAQRLGLASGPFWGHPPGRVVPGLGTRRPVCALSPWRLVEERARRAGWGMIQSAYKLAYTGAVGSQTLTGLPWVHRLLERLGPRGRLWPFDTGWGVPEGAGCVVIAEVWPTLTSIESTPGPCKDARQVAALRDWALEDAARLVAAFARPAGLEDESAERAERVEGWIVGLA